MNKKVFFIHILLSLLLLLINLGAICFVVVSNKSLWYVGIGMVAELFIVIDLFYTIKFMKSL